MIYIASPFFNEKEREVYRKTIDMIHTLFPEEDLYIPADHEIKHAWDIPNKKWGEEVFKMDIEALDKSQMVIVIDWGMYSDTGTAWECGYAYAKNKDVWVFSVGEQEVTSLMVANGCTRWITPNKDIEVK